MPTALVSISWLKRNISSTGLILLDASMNKVVGKTPLVYDSPTYLPNSQKLSLETDFCDLESSLTHTLPTTDQFLNTCSKLGISDDNTVVIYDNQGIYSAPRAWWTFKIMGFDKVFVLDGGLPQWLDEGNPVVTELTSRPKSQTLQLEPQQGKFCDSKFVFSKIKDKNASTFDARSYDRFTGQKPEPRAGVRSGHIPGSISLPFSKVLNGYKLKSTEELKKTFAPFINSKHIFSCGSGITACILILAAHEAGIKELCLYDGSWSDWGSNESLPIELE